MKNIILSCDATLPPPVRANEKLPKIPDSYPKIIYYKFDGDYDTKTYKPINIAPGLNSEQREEILDNYRENVPLDPLTYMFTGNRDGDLVIFN